MISYNMLRSSADDSYSVTDYYTSAAMAEYITRSEQSAQRAYLSISYGTAGQRSASSSHLSSSREIVARSEC